MYEFEPDGYVGEGWVVTAQAMLVGKYGTVVALQIENNDPEHRIHLALVNKSNKQASSAFLIDAQNNEYYYPIATDLQGEVAPGRPRAGLVVFEPARYPTDDFELHLSGVKLSSNRGDSDSLVFRYRSDELASSVQETLASPSLVEAAKRKLAAMSEDARSAIEQARSNA